MTATQCIASEDDSPSVYVGPCDVGRGVFAARPFEAGELVLVFEGTVMPTAQAHAIPELECLLLQIQVGYYLLPHGPGRYTNHSCAPNARIRGALELVALRDIAAHEEVRFDYSTTILFDRWTMACHCGAPSCRRVVGDIRNVPAAVQERYRALNALPDFVRRYLWPGEPAWL